MLTTLRYRSKCERTYLPFSLRHYFLPILQNKESLTLIKTIVDVQPRAAGSGGGDTPDQIVWRISDQTRSKIAKSIDKSLINPDLMIPDDMGQLHSLTTVLIHETDRFNTLLHLIHHSLNELQKAIKVSLEVSYIRRIQVGKN